MRFVTQFDGNREDLTHGDLLRLNALALAARQDIEAMVETVDESTVEVTLPSGKRIVASDWDNVRSALLRAAV